MDETRSWADERETKRWKTKKVEVFDEKESERKTVWDKRNEEEKSYERKI